MILDALASEFRNELAITNDPCTGPDLDANELAYVVENEMGSKLQDPGVEMVVVDNDRKAHRKATQVAFQKFDIKV